MTQKWGELGDTLIRRRKQRIGIARAFLHDTGSLVLMDEPTSNLDSLNEGIILKSRERIGKNQDSGTGVLTELLPCRW